MALFKYIGPYERTYPDIVTGGHVLVVEPGERVEFEADPPGDGWWVAEPVAKKTRVKD